MCSNPRLFITPGRLHSIKPTLSRIALAQSTRSSLPVYLQSRQNNTMATDYTKLARPSFVYVDFCLVPLGTGNPSVAEEVAECQRVLDANKVDYKLHSAGTTVEGPWDDVMRAIGQAHQALLERGVVRIQTSMRVGTRTDKVQRWKEKIDRVEDLLAKDKK